jgi:hypothetical protein
MTWLEIIKQPTFWILSAFASVALSIVANLLTPRVRALLKQSKAERETSRKEKQQQRLNHIRNLCEDSSLRFHEKLDGIYWLLRGILLVVAGLLLIRLIAAIPFLGGILLDIPAFALGALCMSRSVAWLQKAKESYEAVRLADQRLKLATASDVKEWEEEQFGIPSSTETESANKRMESNG